jgi:hypothetical protein
MRHPSVEGWRRNARHRGTVLGEDAIEARFFPSGNVTVEQGLVGSHAVISSRLLKAGSSSVVVPLGSFRCRPVFSRPFTFRFQRLRKTRAPTLSGVPSLPRFPEFPEEPKTKHKPIDHSHSIRRRDTYF